jgi:hypothetical protein
MKFCKIVKDQINGNLMEWNSGTTSPVSCQEPPCFPRRSGRNTRFLHQSYIHLNATTVFKCQVICQTDAMNSTAYVVGVQEAKTMNAIGKFEFDFELQSPKITIFCFLTLLIPFAKLSIMSK